MAAARHNPGSVLTIPIGVIVACETVAHPWKDQVWRPVAVVLDAEPGLVWRELHRSDGIVQYLAPVTSFTLRPRDAVGYRINLANGEPVIYVVLRDAPPCGASWPVEVCLVTASPLEVQDLGDAGEDTVYRVAMPDALVARVRAFVDGFGTVDRHP